MSENNLGNSWKIASILHCEKQMIVNSGFVLFVVKSRSAFVMSEWMNEWINK